MIEIWKVGPRVAAVTLLRQGFSAQESHRLVELKQRCERGDFDDPTDAQNRLLFARWLVQHGRLNEGVSVHRPPPVQG